MRRVYCSTCPWTQWLLLASVAILHGQKTPTLDSASLHILQGTLDEKLASSQDVLGDTEEESNLSVEQMKEKTGGIEENTADDTISFTMDDIDTNEDSGRAHKADKSLTEAKLTSQKSNTQNDPSLSKECNFSEEKHNQLSCLPSTKETKSPQQEIHSFPKGHSGAEGRNVKETSLAHHKQHCHKDDLPNSHRSSRVVLHQHSIGIQVTPKKLGIVSSKWVQVKVPRQIQVGVQTEPLPSHETVQVENLETQTHDEGYVGCLSKTFADKEAQTIIKNKRDTSSQTGNENVATENQPSQPLWRVISLSGIPKRRKYFAPVKKYKMNNNVDNAQEENNNSGKELENISTETSDQKGKHFHGRPMLKGKTTQPLEIPLNCVGRLSDSALQDPRVALKLNIK